MTRFLRRIAGSLLMAGLIASSLAACSDSDDASDSDSSESAADTGDSGDAVASDGGDFLSGTSEEWLEVACPGAWKESSTDFSSRGGEDREPGGFHCDQQNNGDDYKYTELYFYKTDPTEHWDGFRTRADADSFVNYAIGQVSESEWAVFWEDTSGDESQDPDLPGLEEFGFEVYVNHQNPE